MWKNHKLFQTSCYKFGKKIQLIFEELEVLFSFGELL